MNSKIVKCCAKDCPTILTSDCYRFPEEPELVREFLTILEREDLLSLSIDQLRDNYLFCPLHVDVVPDEPSFVEEDKVVREPVRQTLRQPLANVQDSDPNIYPNAMLENHNVRVRTMSRGVHSLARNSNSSADRRNANATIPNFSNMTCPFCSKMFNGTVALENHREQCRINFCLSRVTQARTSEGGQSHSAESNLQIVRNLVPNSTEMSCPLCGKGFCSPNTLRNHVLKYHRIPGENIIQVASPSISASESSHSSSESFTSSTRQEIDPIPNGGKWKCTFCNKVFPDVDKYRRHMLKRHRDFFCENCDKSFKTAGYFRTHKRLHCKSKAMKRSN